MKYRTSIKIRNCFKMLERHTYYFTSCNNSCCKIFMFLCFPLNWFPRSKKQRHKQTKCYKPGGPSLMNKVRLFTSKSLLTCVVPSAVYFRTTRWSSCQERYFLTRKGNRVLFRYAVYVLWPSVTA
jgi:hypothetical protein